MYCTLEADVWDLRHKVKRQKRKHTRENDASIQFFYRWDIVFVGFFLQFCMGVFVLRTTVGFAFFDSMGNVKTK